MVFRWISCRDQSVTELRGLLQFTLKGTMIFEFSSRIHHSLFLQVTKYFIVVPEQRTANILESDIDSTNKYNGPIPTDTSSSTDASLLHSTRT